MKTGQPLAVFARDITLLATETCIVPPQLPGMDFQLLRVSGAGGPRLGESGLAGIRCNCPARRTSAVGLFWRRPENGRLDGKCCLWK